MSFKPSASDTISLSWEDEELFPDEDDTAQSNSTPAGPPHTAAGTASAQPAPNRCGTAVWKDSSREAVANCRETADGERGHARYADSNGSRPLIYFPLQRNRFEHQRIDAYDGYV